MLHTRGGATSCGNCGWGGIEVNDAYLSFAGQRLTRQCPGCPVPFDYWDRLVESISDRSDLWHPVAMAGGFSTMFMASVPRGEQLSLELSDYGIPSGALIYKVLHTIQNDMHPTSGMTVLAHVTQRVGGQHLPDYLRFQPVVVGAGAEDKELAGEDLHVAFTVVWAPSQADTPAQGLLLSAFGAYGEGDMKRSLLDADSAVDISLKQLVTPELVKGWTRKLPNLGFEQRLLVLTAAAPALGMTPLPPFILESLLDLRGERNKVAHGTNAQVEAAQAARLNAGALVAMNHFRQMHAEAA